MDNYIVSARKYRPSTFKSVVGQKALTTTLKNAITSNKLAHAYLFCGPRGVGKTSCARIFAKTINCMNPTADGEACNECESCKAFNEQRSFNIHELDAASNNLVDDIRQLIDQVRIPPPIGKYSVFIIDEVHMLSSQAFNAFLKTLEEPPHHAIFILATTEKQKVIPTILSRCQIYDFTRISAADIAEHLEYVASCEGIKAEPEALNVIAQKADGGMRDALSVFDQVSGFTNGNITYQAVIANLNVLDYDYFFRFTEAFLAGNVRESLLLLNEIIAKGFDGQNVVNGLASYFRDLLVSKDPSTLVLLDVGASVRDRYKEIAQRCPDQMLFRAIEIANSCDLNYKASRNKRLLVELMLIQLCQLSNNDGDNEESKKKLQIKPLKPSEPQKVEQPQTVAVTAPVVAPAPQVTSSPVNPTVKVDVPSKSQPTKNIPGALGLGISLKSFGKEMEKDQQQKDQEVQNNPKKEGAPYTEADLVRCWEAFANTQLEQDYFRSTMLNSKPELGENDHFIVKVQNPSQQDNLLGNTLNILSYIRKELHNNNIVMQIVVEEGKTDDRPLLYTASEKLEHLEKVNPAMTKLKEVFHLTPD